MESSTMPDAFRHDDLQHDLNMLTDREYRKLMKRERKMNRRKNIVVPITQSKKYNEQSKIILEGKTDNQRRYINLLNEKDQVFVYGCAGTGKTYIAATYAAMQLKTKKVNRIVLTRPNIASGPSLGAFPGSITEKMAPWVAPFTDVLKAHLGIGAFECALKNGQIEIVPFETMRGRSFSDAIVICDEAQNVDQHCMKMLLTRIGEGSKLIVNGDTTQSDLKTKESGLAMAIRMIASHGIDAGVVEFTEDDIVRSEIVKSWIRAFNRE